MITTGLTSNLTAHSPLFVLYYDSVHERFTTCHIIHSSEASFQKPKLATCHLNEEHGNVLLLMVSRSIHPTISTPRGLKLLMLSIFYTHN